MVQLTRIYTKSGDKGKTSLGSGERVTKTSERICAIGTVDEANALLGVVRLSTQSQVDIDTVFARLQNDLFDVGADLCLPLKPTSESTNAPLRVTQNQVSFLENQIDTLNAQLSPLTSFVLPGGTPASAHLHHARTVVRRAEREVCQLMQVENEACSPLVLSYLNRLSDYLFVAARFLNNKGEGDVLWVPGGPNTYPSSEGKSASQRG